MLATHRLLDYIVDLMRVLLVENRLLILLLLLLRMMMVMMVLVAMCTVKRTLRIGLFNDSIILTLQFIVLKSLAVQTVSIHVLV